ncbi:DUF3667 domain-containing protein [Flagellimonas zhangzhouensis]|uniref:DUF3667 domain-containing protein n=1 Tax=Flagellimonas zhangzhouensis TaxID=1073328 RepID=A0A1H2QKS3_9FLAO|nr:DUF3667 domain-containing protein [Allomuricauda zhangzhouensis]SDQ53928.1 Protein of unknown function [Allomuricauda zhangzhouensis]SDW07264.1 Protein of unknown function [Allomuricauda zhangzhouensis]
MTCKNCEAKLRTDYLYCPNCGGKVIRNRITIKYLWFDVLDRYFNLDNTFVNTFIHLFTKPEIVIEGYIHGLRKKYLNPISYLGIALTLSGLLIFMMTKSIDFMQFDIFDVGIETDYQKKLMAFVMDYQSLIFIIFIPLMAIAGWLCFDEKKYNFAERTIIFMYALSHFSIVIFLPSLLLLIIAPENYMTFSMYGSLYMLVYASYVVIRTSSSKGLAIVTRLILFNLLFGVLYIMTSTLFPIIMLLTGELTLQDMLPPEK